MIGIPSSIALILFLTFLLSNKTFSLLINNEEPTEELFNDIDWVTGADSNGVAITTYGTQFLNKLNYIPNTNYLDWSWSVNTSGKI